MQAAIAAETPTAAAAAAPAAASAAAPVEKKGLDAAAATKRLMSIARGLKMT